MDSLIVFIGYALVEYVSFLPPAGDVGIVDVTKS
jgi:hypothetical protein